MTREQEFFLNTLADHLHGRATNPPKEMDWLQISRYSKNHEVEGIIYYQCKRYLSQYEELSELNDRFSKASAASLFYYANRALLVNQLKKALDAEKISYFFVKGAEIAQFYPVPAYRTMGDTDLVVHTEDRERVYEIMMSRGYRCEFRPEVGEWGFFKNGLEIELHDHLIYPLLEKANNTYQKNAEIFF